VTFVTDGECFLVGDVIGRGWCVPSGRIEDGETPEQAAVRETLEETGTVIENPISVGYFQLDDCAVSAMLAPLPSEPCAFSSPETRSVRVMGLADLSTSYYLWTPDIERAFKHALEVLRGYAPLPRHERGQQ